MLYTHLVPSHKIKDIKLPFNGLYNSFIGTELDSAIENDAYNLTEEQSDKLYDYINNNYRYLSAQSKYNDKICKGYAEHLASLIQDYFQLENFYFDKVEYVRMDGMNRGDTLHVNVNTDYLPSIEKIANILSLTIDEVWQGLQDISNDNLTSYDGFSSFYDNDITPLRNVSYDKWNDGYIMVLVKYLSYNLDIIHDKDYPVNDIEQSYLESINTIGGSIEIMMDCLDNDNCELLNSLLCPDD